VKIKLSLRTTYPSQKMSGCQCYEEGVVVSHLSCKIVSFYDTETQPADYWAGKLPVSPNAATTADMASTAGQVNLELKFLRTSGNIVQSAPGGNEIIHEYMLLVSLATSGVREVPIPSLAIARSATH
jgi:hypothetical protein